MGFLREKKNFRGFCDLFGGECRLLRRGWERNGDREVEVLRKVGESRCLLTGMQNTLPDIDPAAMNRARAKLYLPAEVDMQAGDLVEVHWGKNIKRFSVVGAPQEYPVYQMAEIQKEEWL